MLDCQRRSSRTRKAAPTWVSIQFRSMLHATWCTAYSQWNNHNMEILNVPLPALRLLTSRFSSSCSDVLRDTD